MTFSDIPDEGACYVLMNDGRRALKIYHDRVLLTRADALAMLKHLRELTRWLEDNLQVFDAKD